MSVLINKDTRVLVQGITGSQGLFHSKQMLKYGTKIVAGCTPGKGGKEVGGVPVFNTVEEAKKEEGVDASIIFVPPPFAADAILEALDAEIDLVICITEGVPVRDMIKVKEVLAKSKSRLIGPNCPGVITPEECKMGIMPGFIHKKGSVGVVSRSGTLTYEAVSQLTELGIGQSTCIGIGGDPILGTNHKQAVQLFNEDPDTEAIVMIGEIGGSTEEEAGDYIKEQVDKPVVAFIAGQTAPKGKRMGHAGAIVAGKASTAESKMAYLEECGIAISKSPAEIGKTLQKVIS